jgi:hypothetical protein
MSRDTRIGLGSVLLGLFGIAAFYLWPNQKCVGWASLTCCVILAGLWTVLEYREKKKRKNSQPESSKPRIEPSVDSGWEKIADRFKEFERSGIEARYTHWSMNGDESWELSGGKIETRAYFKSLCKLAGAMLQRTPSAELSEKLRSYDDDFSRWLLFLKENHRASVHVSYADLQTDDGGTSIVLFVDIRDVAQVSMAACIECAAREMGN